MHLRRAAAAPLSLLSLLLLLSSTAAAFNITQILSKHPSLSTFNHYLTKTRLAAEINHRDPITVCAVDNAAMATLLSRRPSLHHIKKALSHHAILAYYDAEALHNLPSGLVVASTLFDPNPFSGLVQIQDSLDGDLVGFSLQGSTPTALFVKSFLAVPNNISVIQISAVLPLTRS